MNWDEAKNIVSQRWTGMSHWLHREEYPPQAWLAPLVDALSQHPRIGKLYPYTSHQILCLSRTTEYPWSGDCPTAEAVKSGHFRICGSKYVIAVRTHKEYRWKEAEYEVLGEGGVSAAVGWIEAALPENCGPAIRGNLDDLRRFEGKSVTDASTRALHTAAAQGDVDAVSRLLETGVNVNASEYDGLNALMIAVMCNRAALVRWLLETGADVHARNHDNETALSLATFGNRLPEILELLKNSGATE